MLSYFSHVRLCVTPWTVTHQVPLSVRFSRQEYWSGFLCHPPGDLPNQVTEPAPLRSPALAGGFFTTRPLEKPRTHTIYSQIKSWFIFFVMFRSLGHFLLSSEYFTLRNLQCSRTYIQQREWENERESYSRHWNTRTNHRVMTVGKFGK